jgi:hypothetical protein
MSKHTLHIHILFIRKLNLCLAPSNPGHYPTVQIFIRETPDYNLGWDTNYPAVVVVLSGSYSQRLDSTSNYGHFLLQNLQLILHQLPMIRPHKICVTFIVH